jgi:hypothetical protein
MPHSAILHEVQQLYDVSDRLDSLAGQHPLVTEALTSISGSVCNTATLLEVLVATKIAPLSGLDPAKPDWLVAVFKFRFGIRSQRLVVKDDI